MVEPKSSAPTTTRPKNEPGISTTRIRTIMKSTDDTDKQIINHEGLHVMTKATEMFIQYLAKNSMKNAKNSLTLNYDCLSQLVNDEENLEFLLQIIPQKITVKEFKQIIARGDKDSSEEDDSSSEEEESEKKTKKKEQ